MKRIAQNLTWNEIRHLLNNAKRFTEFRSGSYTVHKLGTQEYQIWQGENYIGTWTGCDDVAYYLINHRKAA